MQKNTPKNHVILGPNRPYVLSLYKTIHNPLLSFANSNSTYASLYLAD